MLNTIQTIVRREVGVAGIAIDIDSSIPPQAVAKPPAYEKNRYQPLCAVVSGVMWTIHSHREERKLERPSRLLSTTPISSFSGCQRIGEGSQRVLGKE